MKWSLAIVAVALVAVFWLTDSWRFIKTIYLIARVSPYEQSGVDNKKILILGDSTGYGTGASQSADSIAGLIGSDFPTFSIINNSINGRTIGELVSVTESMSTKYEIIVLQIGGNDIIQKRNIDQVMLELDLIYKNLNLLTKNIVMISAGNVGAATAFSGKHAADYQTLSKRFHKRAELFAQEREGFEYINLFEEPETDPFVLHPNLYLSIDGLHPSSEGYKLWYEKLKPSLLRIIKL